MNQLEQVRPDTIRLDGSATLYRLYDLANTVDLEQAADLLGTSTRGRARPQRLEARALEIRHPPLVVSLVEEEIDVGGTMCATAASAHLFEFGVCSLQLRATAPRGSTWSSFVEFAEMLDASPKVVEFFQRALTTLFARLQPALDHPAIAPVVEEYKVYRIDKIEADAGTRSVPLPATRLFSDASAAALLVGERRNVSAGALRELVPHRFSYYDDDLAIVSWESALIVEPRADDRDVEFVLEFANAQLLELRMYDLQLDSEIPVLYDRVAAARSHPSITGRFRRVLSDLQTKVGDITETVERVENALKVTNDVYLARIYSAALELFREQVWRRGIERKLGILRETYAMLNTEAQAGRMELLELVVVLLILAELAVAVVPHS
ncbi:MAG TPA: hypothetical protein VGM50_19870 [Gemmatimonadaceae bacterium]